MKTPFQKLGYKPDDEFGVTGVCEFSLGTLVSLLQDDNTDVPLFQSKTGHNYYVNLCNLVKISIDTPCDGVAQKFDNDKPMMSLVDPEWELGVAEILTFGAKKYSPYNWQGLDVRRIEDALLRHVNAHRRGEKLDGESGNSHLLHASCCLMMLHWMENNGE